MGLFNLFRKPSASAGSPEWDGQAFALDDPRVPAGITARIRQDFGEGYQLVYAHTAQGGEWWLLDGDELLEAYWLE